MGDEQGRGETEDRGLRMVEKIWRSRSTYLLRESKAVERIKTSPTITDMHVAPMQ